MAQRPSMLPVVEKAQQEPQLPWFFTGVTAPCCRQSQSSGTASFSSSAGRDSRIPFSASAGQSGMRT